MTDFHSLDADVRTIALVGRFLQAWAFMEIQLNTAIGKALGLTGLQEAILTSNVQLRDKIHTLRTIFEYALLASPTELKKFDRLLLKIAKKSAYRNMMAHDPFGPSGDEKGVRFLIVRAKGKYNSLEVVWNVARFTKEFCVIEAYEEQLKKLVNRLQYSSFIRETLTKPSQPNAPWMQPGGGGFLGLLTPFLQNSATDPAKK